MEEKRDVSTHTLSVSFSQIKELSFVLDSRILEK